MDIQYRDFKLDPPNREVGNKIDVYLKDRDSSLGSWFNWVVCVPSLTVKGDKYWGLYNIHTDDFINLEDPTRSRVISHWMPTREAP